jgi:hypothetical protein
MSEPQYKLVDGVLVELTPEEIAQIEADGARNTAQQHVSQPDFDFGPSMAEILGTTPKSGS